MVTFEEEKFKLEFKDKSSTNINKKLKEEVQSSDAFLILFSITQQATFKEVSKFYDLIQTCNSNSKKPIILVGTKCDLEDERVVSKSVAISLSESWGIQYLETSAKIRVNVDEVFTEIIREIKTHQLTLEIESKLNCKASCCHIF